MRRSVVPLFPSLLFALQLFATTAIAQQELLAPLPETNDRLGSSVALSGDGETAVVGAFRDDTANGLESGSVQIYAQDATETWNHQQELLAADGAPSDEFGFAVATSGSGDDALVGAPERDGAAGSGAGAAYLFTRDGSGSWSSQHQFFAPDAEADDHFGHAVALSTSGDVALVGAWSDDTPGGTDAGSVHVFSRTAGGAWSHQQQLFASDGAPFDNFGFSVAISATGDRAAIGAFGDNTTAGFNTGSAYVFSRAQDGTWSEDQIILVPGALEGDGAGEAIALAGDGETLLLGAALRNASPSSPDSGAAYAFTLGSDGNWTLQTVLSHPSGARADDRFGRAVSLSSNGNTALVGAPLDDVSSSLTNVGSVHQFHRNFAGVWTSGLELHAPNELAEDQFGKSVSLSASGEALLVGAWLDDGSGTIDAGSAWVIETEPFRFVVNDTADDIDANPGDGVCSSSISGLCTLRAAIEETEALPGGNEIYVPPGTYILDRVPSGPGDLRTGTLRITDWVSILGTGSGVALDGNLTSSVINVIVDNSKPSAEIRLKNLQISHGLGGIVFSGINGGGSLVVDQCTVSENQGSAISAFGGSAALIHIVDSVLADNSGSGFSGEFDFGLGHLLIERTKVLNNDASGITLGEMDGVTLDEVLIEGNETSFSGGGIFITADLFPTIRRSRIVNNTAELDGGGMLSILGYFVGVVEDTEISGNVAGRSGGGISIQGSMPLLVRNSTISGNQAQTGGGVSVDSRYGISDVQLEHSVIVQNSATTAGGLDVPVGVLDEAGTAQTRGSIIAENSDLSGYPDCRSARPITSLGHNLVGVDCGTIAPSTGDLIGTLASPIDPRLEPLKANGGPARTHRLESDSPALDAAEADCLLAFDQRGLPRPVDGDGNAIAACDIGAFEVQNECSDGLDDDGDGLVDFPEDPGCANLADQSERDDLIVCDDGLDNDEDGVADFPADPGCLSPNGTTEVPEPLFLTSIALGAGYMSALARRRRLIAGQSDRATC